MITSFVAFVRVAYGYRSSDGDSDCDLVRTSRIRFLDFGSA